MKKILVPVDFSDTSLNALHYSIELFGPMNLDLTILHTYQPSTRAFHMISLDKVLGDDASVEMDALVEKIQSDHPQMVIRTKIIKSDPVTTISSLGRQGDYDFIVMGTKGASGLKEVFIGSVAGGVIARTNLPVLVVPSNFRFKPTKNISFAVSDLGFSAVIVKPLRDLLELSGAKLNLLHVTDEYEPMVEDLTKPLEDLDPSITYIIGDGDVNKQLIEHLHQDDTQMLCLIRTKKGFFTRLFGKSVTLKQTFHSPVPLLILHED